MPIQLLHAGPASSCIPTDRVLAAIGFDAPVHPGLRPGAPFLRVAMPVLHGDPYEIWLAAGPVRHGRIGEVAYATDGGVLMAVAEAPPGPVRPAVRALYRTMFEALDRAGFPHALRFWNYLPDITGTEAGEERYRLFNQGRREAFAGRAPPPLPPPAASALGSRGGRTALVALAARRPGLPIENPRQTSAYRYPARYGPASPDFSRALAFGDRLFISGTASIVGHASRHPNDAAAQARELVANLHAVIGEAARRGAAPHPRGPHLKTYLRRAEDLPRARAVLERAFPDQPPATYLLADICRPELLLETEALQVLGATTGIRAG